ncbi:MAG: succinyl-diaminopimelate desuccinylase [Brooklawnia sp.]|jgi:succinyl-diaminopimelate desuccinylase
MLPNHDLLELFRAIIDIESVSRNERELADAVEATLRPHQHLEVLRDGDAVLARTSLGRPERVIIAGHLDTVPVAGNLPSKVVPGEAGELVYGRGSCDMKGGIAAMVWLAQRLDEPTRDITWVFYDCEEIDFNDNGLGRLTSNHPDWFAADLAVLMEPTGARIEGGCQGTMRFGITTTGLAAHSARSWLGHNAIHDMAAVIDRTREFTAAEIEVDGLAYHEGLNATMITGGLAPNVVPDACTVQINYRFAPDKSAEQAQALMTDWYRDWTIEVLDLSQGARPGLDQPAAAAFVQAVGGEPRAKYGWTDVSRFAALGMPAVNFGPGDPGKAHAADEFCPLADVQTCVDALTRWLT